MRLATVQKLMVRKMMKLKRRPVCDSEGKNIGTEPWLEWQIRSMSNAGSEIKHNNVRVEELLDNERISWAGKVSRFGLAGSAVHLCKFVVAWRSKSWWETQKWYNDLGWSVLKHKWPFKPRRWEDGLPINWISEFCNHGPMGHIL